MRMDLEERGGHGKLGEVEGKETVARMYSMRQESVFNKRKKSINYIFILQIIYCYKILLVEI